MKKYYIPFSIALILLTIIVFNGYIFTDRKITAVYFTSDNSSLINFNDIKKNEIVVVHSLNDLISKVESLDYRIGILLDKSILDNDNTINNINKWVTTQKGYPILAIGYGNPTYIFFKRLDFAIGVKNPTISKEKIEKYKNEVGFSFTYICNNGIIHGKGYKEKISIPRILNVVNEALKGEEYVKQMIERRTNE